MLVKVMASVCCILEKRERGGPPLDLFITALSNAMRKRGAMAFAYFNELKKLIQAPAEEHAEEEDAFFRGSDRPTRARL